MPRLLSRVFATTTFALLYLGCQVKAANERTLDDVPCHESGRFYRNPNRPDNQVWTTEECAKYYLCLEGEVFEFHCSQGLLFDVNRQLCDKQQNVHNCEMTTESKIVRPLLEEAPCANDTHLGCADGNCMPAEYFCDGSTDCSDASDESWCDANYDPNAAQPCDPVACLLPECYCSPTGYQVPGALSPNQIPQMVTLTYDGPVNHENWDFYNKHIFTPEKKNHNGCQIKGTFFVAHPYTNYRHVQTLWNEGHEIAVNSITHRGPEEWWSKNATIEEWFDEMVGEANIINRFGRVRMEDFRGLRVPYLSVGSNRQFLMMQEFGFVYDATVVAPLGDVAPYWPYTLDYKMPHICTGMNQICPTRSYAGLWEMVINPLANGDHSCATIEYCPSTLTGDEVFDLLMANFKRHYLSNRAPFGLHINPKWLKNYEYLVAYKKFITELLRMPDVYFVTYKQVIDWMKRPTPAAQMRKFPAWQCKPRFYEDYELPCTQPNTCKLSSRVLEHDKYMITCSECPKSYPWIRNEFGFD